MNAAATQPICRRRRCAIGREQKLLAKSDRGTRSGFTQHRRTSKYLGASINQLWCLAGKLFHAMLLRYIPPDAKKQPISLIQKKETLEQFEISDDAIRAEPRYRDAPFASDRNVHQPCAPERRPHQCA